MSDLKPLYEKLSPILRDQARYEYTDELSGAIIDAIAPEIEAPLLARIAELEALVEDAYREGWSDGHSSVGANRYVRDEDWKGSITRAALNGE